MCLLLLAHKMLPGYPVLIAANRDEFVERQGSVPEVLASEPLVVGGRDARARGTWLAINGRGLVAAVTNRHSTRPENPKARSRGLLCLDLARCPGVREATEALLEGLSREPYNPCNVVLCDGTSARIAHIEAKLRVAEIEPGLHAVTEADIDDRSDGRLDRALTLAEDQRHETLEEWVSAFEAACRDHGMDKADGRALCLHGDKIATLSSAVIAVSDRHPEGSLYLHAQGNPCEAPYQDYSELLC